MAFVLILSVINITGLDSTFVIDHNLTREDCNSLLIQWNETLDQYSTVVCEVEH